jgi:AraC-like DNA-binding protein
VIFLTFEIAEPFCNFIIGQPTFPRVNMKTSAADFSLVRFSTRTLPERDRLPMWREEFGRRVVLADIEPLSNVPFCAEATLRALPGLRTVTCTGSATHFERTAAQAAASDGSMTLFINLGAKAVISNRGQETALGKGDAVLVGPEPAIVTTSDAYLGVIIPRAMLACRVSELDSATMRLIHRGGAPLELLASYLGELNNVALSTPHLQRTVVSHAHDLAALALGATRDAAAIANGRAVPAARLHAIKTEIVNDLNRDDLSLTELSARHGVTPRYVQILFENEGTTFSRFLLDQRLKRAYCMLSDLRLVERTISAIAYEAGFSDLSHFNRSFRRRYGESPSDVRSSARGIDG